MVFDLNFIGPRLPPCSSGTMAASGRAILQHGQGVQRDIRTATRRLAPGDRSSVLVSPVHLEYASRLILSATESARFW